MYVSHPYILVDIQTFFSSHDLRKVTSSSTNNTKMLLWNIEFKTVVLPSSDQATMTDISTGRGLPYIIGILSISIFSYLGAYLKSVWNSDQAATRIKIKVLLLSPFFTSSMICLQNFISLNILPCVLNCSEQIARFFENGLQNGRKFYVYKKNKVCSLHLL